MHIVDPEDLSLLPLTKRQRATFESIEKSLRDATRRLDAMDSISKRLDDLAAEVAAGNKRRSEDAAIVAEWRETGRMPAAMLSRGAL
jgi:hypothetical protein